MLKKHCEFNSKYDAYVLLAVSRKKDSPEITNSKEIVFRRIIKRPEDIKRKYLDISSQIKNYKDENGKSFPFYLYVSLNARDAYQASQGLMNRILFWMNEERKGNDRSRMYKRIDGHFYSQLMKKECKTKAQKYFMIDYDDDKDRINTFMKELIDLDVEIMMRQPTKGGYHIKVKPFDRRLPDLDGWDAEVKADANLFVEYFPVKKSDQ